MMLLSIIVTSHCSTVHDNYIVTSHCSTVNDHHNVPVCSIQHPSKQRSLITHTRYCSMSRVYLVQPSAPFINVIQYSKSFETHKILFSITLPDIVGYCLYLLFFSTPGHVGLMRGLILFLSSWSGFLEPQVHKISTTVDSRYYDTDGIRKMY
jgi:hypothetical protein